MARRAGETLVIRSVYAARVGPTRWENWRPDPAWPLLSLSKGWDVV